MVIVCAYNRTPLEFLRRGLRIEYDLAWPLSYVIDEPSMELYNRLFRYILRVSPIDGLFGKQPGLSLAHYTLVQSWLMTPCSVVSSQPFQSTSSHGCRLLCVTTCLLSPAALRQTKTAPAAEVLSHTRPSGQLPHQTPVRFFIAFPTSVPTPEPGATVRRGA